MNQYAINTKDDFFNLKSFAKYGILALGVTSAFASNASSFVEHYIPSKFELVSNNSSFTDLSKNIEDLKEETVIRQTVTDFSPYEVSKIVFSTIGEGEDLVKVIDVYTKEYTSKDNNKLFEAEGTVLSSLPENYFVRYF